MKTVTILLALILCSCSSTRYLNMSREELQVKEAKKFNKKGNIPVGALVIIGAGMFLGYSLSYQYMDHRTSK